MCGGVHYGEVDWSLEKAYVGFVSDPPHPIIQPSIFKSPQIFVRKFFE